MPDLMVRKVSPEVHKVLRESAESHGRSLNSEILVILEKEAGEAQRRLEMRKAMRKLRRFRKKVSEKYPVHYEMWELIREDRDAR